LVDFLKKPVSAIFGIDSKKEKVLAKLNVKTIGDLRKLSLEKLKSLFGSLG